MSVDAALIVNPTSGYVRYPRDVETVEEIFAREGREVRVLPTQGPLHARELARAAVEEGISRVISLGGDGTLNEVINGIAGADVVLGIIPAGISNVFALELGIPFEIAAAARLILAGRTRRFDLGRVNGRLFCLMASIGLDAYACKVVKPGLKRCLKRYAFHLAGLQALLGFRPQPFTVETDDGSRWEGHALVVSNASYYGGPHRITPAARPDDGLLDFCIYLKGGRGDYLRYFSKVLRGTIQEDPGVAIGTCRGIRVDSPDLPLQIDGDYIGETPALIEVCPGMLEVFC